MILTPPSDSVSRGYRIGCQGHSRARRSPSDDNVVNLQDEPDALGRERDGRGVDEERDQHVLLEDVCHLALAHVDARRLLALRMLVPQLRHDVDGVEPRILGERVRDHLHRLGERAHAVRVHAEQRVGPLGELVREPHLRGAAARREEPLLDEAAQHAERVVQRALRLVEHEVVGRLAQDGDGLALVRHARHAHNLAVARRHLVDELRAAELFRVEGIDVCDGQAAARLADELDVVAFDVLDDEDLHLCEEVQRQVVDRVSQDRLLDEQHVAAALLHLLAHVEDVLALLLEDPVHLRVVRDGHVLLDVGLWRRKAKLDQANLGAGDLGRPASRVRHLLGEDEPVDELGVVDGAAELLDGRDVAQVDVCGGGGVDDGEQRVHGERRKQRGVVGDDLRVERRRRRLDELLAVA
mmetsp:Transcript_39722/g.122315  ORF Transcript_39722/g.122315 Transcript_39722/m.122315 type:complete len:411 (-) Transcript_39722:501-1733(-)